MIEGPRANPSLSVKVQVSGGLGNQLFMLVRAVGLSYELSEAKVSAQFASHMRGRQLSVVNHLDMKSFLGPTIKMLNLESKGSFSRGIIRLLSLEQRLAIDELGFSPTPVFQPKKTTRLIGYFQSNLYLQALRQYGAPFELEPLDPSPIFSRLSSDIAAEKVGLLHVRKGDYANHSSTIGLLDIEYFSSASERLRHSGVKQILVSSDDRGWLKENLRSLPKFDYLDISSIPFRGDYEVLALASTVDVIACSNSSFSWWAAMSGKKKLVIKPSKWYKGMDDPNRLFDESQVENIPSSWC